MVTRTAKDDWNRVPVNKIFIQQQSPIDPEKVKVMIPIYEPLETSKCKKGGKTSTQNELIKKGDRNVLEYETKISKEEYCL